MKRRTKTARLTRVASAKSSGLMPWRRVPQATVGRVGHGAEVVEGDLEIVEAEDEAHEEGAEHGWPDVGERHLEEAAKGPRAEDHRGLVEAPVVADQLGQDHEEGEGEAIGRVGEDRGCEVAGQAQDVAVEHERRDADQDLGDEQGGDVEAGQQAAAADRVAEDADGARGREQRREQAGAEADQEAVEQALVEVAHDLEALVPFQGPDRREGPDAVRHQRQVSDVTDWEIEEKIEQAEQQRLPRDGRPSAAGDGCHDQSARRPVKPARRRLTVFQIRKIRASETRNRTTPMAEPSAQVPVASNWCSRMLP